MDNHLLIKPIIKVGNSAGILLPKKWLNGKVKVELIENPLDIRRDILEILDEYLEDIKGIYLIGSYARREQTSRSDVDVLVITNKFAEKIKKGKYDLWLIPENSLKEQLKNNALPLVPMITEAKPLINSKLLEEYKPLSLNEKNLRFHLETTESALEIAKQTLDIIKLKQENNCSDSLIYSLVLRLREVYIVDCILKKSKFSNKGFKDLIKEKTKSLKAYESYLRSKNEEKSIKSVPVEEAESIINYLSSRIIFQKQWIKKEENK